MGREAISSAPMSCVGAAGEEEIEAWRKFAVLQEEGEIAMILATARPGHKITYDRT